MLRTWHSFALETIDVIGASADILASALRREENGNWYGAGENYLQLFADLDHQGDSLTRARVMAKAACSFETAVQPRPAAAAYVAAAQILERTRNMPALTAELFNRAAVAYASVGEFFLAAMNWRACASAFERVGASVINCSENWGPLPIAALKSHLVGLCFEASANAAEKAKGQEMWAVGAYWEAGRAYGSGIPNIQTYWAYRNALLSSIRYYGTLSIERLRTILPLTAAERAEMLNPIEMMERALSWCNEHHQAKPGPSRVASLQTWRELTAAYHSFSAGFTGIGNLREASTHRVKQHDLNRQIFMAERNYFSAAMYWVWKLTASYGESLGRWIISCLAVLLLFCMLFYFTGSIGPVTRKFDYFYFSAITFSTLGYGDIHPISTIGQVLSCLEVGSGFIMLGILLTFVGTRLKEF